MLLYRRGPGPVCGWVVWASSGSAHSGLRPPAFVLIPPNDLGTCSCAEGALVLHVVGSCWLPFGCLTAAFGRRLSFLIPPNNLGTCSCAEGALDLYVVGSCWLPLGCLTAAFGRRLSFLIPPINLGTCSCAEGALDLYVVGSCWLPLGCLTAACGRRLSLSMCWALALVPKGPWTYMWLGHGFF